MDTPTSSPTQSPKTSFDLSSCAGIHAIEVYFPHTYVEQTEYEVYKNVSKGKYTIGLGQDRMAFCNDAEDVNSLAMTVVTNLMKKYDIDFKDIGRLEVGTETILDKSKSIKTILMDLFKASGNYDVEGIDTTNACYGGTNALFNSINWIESNAWDGRYALCVACDVAVYADGPARPTGGCGAVAMLLGRNAPITFEPGMRASHMQHAYDFYKPDLNSEYPTVDGKLSIKCYLSALDNCFEKLSTKFMKKYKTPFLLSSGDYYCFHSPFNALVQKSYGRLVYNDLKARPNDPEYAGVPSEYTTPAKSATTDNHALIKFFQKFSTPGQSYADKVEPGVLLAKELGNTYCASLYSSLCSLIWNMGDALLGKRVVLFSYGSGFASSLFCVKVTSSIKQMQDVLNLSSRLEDRIKVDPEKYTQIMIERDEIFNKNNFRPTGTLDTLTKGTYHLTHCDEQFRRFYACKE